MANKQIGKTDPSLQFDSATVLRIDDLSFSYGDESILDAVNLRLDSGKVLCLRGSNGSGKTTLLHLVAGLYTPLAGKIEVLGKSSRVKGYSANIGFMTQDVALFPELTVRENLQYWSALSGFSRVLRKERIAAVIEMADLSDFIDKKTSACSGGMKRRVHLANVLLTCPPLLLLDEPLAGLDVKQCERLVAVLVKLKRAGHAMLIATHQDDNFLELKDDYMCLQDGHLQKF